MCKILEFIKEKINCWDLLKTEKRPIFIFGMGDGALKIMNVFEQYKIAVAGFFASDEFVRGHSFSNHLVHKLSEIEKEVDDFVIVLAFAASYRNLYDKIFEIAERHTLYAPDVAVAGGGLFTYEYCVENAEKIQQVYEMLEDEISRKTFADVINFKISGKIDYLDKCTTEKSDVYNNIIKPTGEEVYIDLGSYNGDTVEEFISYAGSYKKIVAVEPDKRNFKKLCKNTENLENIRTVNSAVWSSDTQVPFSSRSGRQSAINSKGTVIDAVCVDSMPEGATVIKMDIEGAEREALKGAENTIRNSAPKLMISLYHRNEDLFELPLFIKSMNPNYKFYIRHQLYIPAWETNLYCI